MQGNKQRQYELDWLRVLAFYLLIFYHVGMIFVSWGWHIKSDEPSHTLELIMLFINQWRLPLLFLISGIGVHFAFKKRTPGEFITERSKRLLIPLIFGIFVLVLPQVYVERLWNQDFTGNLFLFVPEFFKGVYPKGNFSWHHLWFLPYLFSFCILYLPLFVAIRKLRPSILSKIAEWLSFKGGVLLLFIPISLSEILLRPYWPSAHNLISDWANFSTYSILFCYGFILANEARFWKSIENSKEVALGLGIVSIVCLYGFFWTQSWEKSYLAVSIYLFLKGLNMWSWLMALTGFARKWLNFNNRFISYANQSVYPFYLIHQTVIVVAAYFILPMAFDNFLSFLLVLLITVLVTLTLYEYFVRRFKLTRVLFGLKT